MASKKFSPTEIRVETHCRWASWCEIIGMRRDGEGEIVETARMGSFKDQPTAEDRAHELRVKLGIIKG